MPDNYEKVLTVRGMDDDHAVLRRNFIYVPACHTDDEIKIVDEYIRRGLRIVRAAIKTADGVVHSLPAPARHSNLIPWVAHEKGYGYVCQDQQGFLTSESTWVDREEAMRIARAANQLIPRDGRPESAVWLYSEDVWAGNYAVGKEEEGAEGRPVLSEPSS